VNVELESHVASPEWERSSGIRTAMITFGAAIAALACLVRFGLSARGVIDAVTAAVLVVLAAIDLERRIIPNRIVLPAAAVVYVAQLAFFPHHALEWTVASVGCALFFLVTLLVYPAGLGMGDVKLGLLLGAALGWGVIAALLLGLLASGLFGVAVLIRHGAEARKKPIPLGPFLAAGALAVLLFG
jgi:leader peptidase (prepilin peptidase)/N-methyltransferase